MKILKKMAKTNNNFTISFFIIAAIVLFFSISWFVFGKEKVKINALIFDYVDTHCPKQKTCVVDLASITPFRWDTAYIFETGDKSMIETKIGMSYPAYEDSFTNKIIFIHKDKIVHSEEYYVDLDFAIPEAKELMFYLDEQVGDYKIHPANAKLSVQKELKQYRRRLRDIELYIARKL